MEYFISKSHSGEYHRSVKKCIYHNNKVYIVKPRECHSFPAFLLPSFLLSINHPSTIQPFSSVERLSPVSVSTAGQETPGCFGGHLPPAGTQEFLGHGAWLYAELTLQCPSRSMGCHTSFQMSTLPMSSRVIFPSHTPTRGVLSTDHFIKSAAY